MQEQMKNVDEYHVLIWLNLVEKSFLHNPHADTLRRKRSGPQAQLADGSSKLETSLKIMTTIKTTWPNWPNLVTSNFFEWFQTKVRLCVLRPL